MFKKKRTTVLLWTGRELNPRNEQFSFDLNTVAIRGHVWFTPEVVISDALSVISDLLWLWQAFKATVPTFSLRVVALVSLIILAVGLKDSPNLVSASSSEPLQAAPNITEIHTVVQAGAVPIYTWPVPKKYISTYFSSYHKGIDLPQSYGLGVRPYTAGTVALAAWDGGFGNSIVINHPNGLSTRYSHLSKINVSVGQQVNTSTIIGNIGSTGFSTGPHLHFEIYKFGKAFNPLSVLP